MERARVKRLQAVGGVGWVEGAMNSNLSYVSLPKAFYSPVTPEAFTESKLIFLNENLLEDPRFRDLGWASWPFAELLSGKKGLKGFEPIALAYAGHQFGHFVPSLGDGRACLLGELQSESGEIFELHLKGTGPTPFSRGGDGFSALGPVIRECIVGEALHFLGVPSTRILAALSTGEGVQREELLPGGVSARLARSHIRIGTFEYFYSRGDLEALKSLVEFSIRRLDSDLLGEPDAYFQFFKRVGRRQITLVNKWMGIGFIHGVLNTDNTLASGEAIDFGPCAFMDEFKFSTVYSSIDHTGRYAYSEQSKIIIWNLSILATCLLPLLEGGESDNKKRLEDELYQMAQESEEMELQTYANKLGLSGLPKEEKELVSDILQELEQRQLDFTNFFKDLPSERGSGFDFLANWRQKLKNQKLSENKSLELMASFNPLVIPRNHLVERAIQLAYQDDFKYFLDLIEVLRKPFQQQEGLEAFQKPPQPHERVRATFCGT